MECNDVLDQLADYLDEDARAELCRVIEEHLSSCTDCQVFVDSVKKTIVLYQADDRSRKVEMPVRATERLSAALAREYQRGEEKAAQD